MRDINRVFELRKNMIDDWRCRGLEWREICHKYRVSKRWFYKLRMRYMLEGYEGLKDRVRKNDNRPHAIGWQQRLKILNYVYYNPTHGPWRIAFENPSVGVCPTAAAPQQRQRRPRRASYSSFPWATPFTSWTISLKGSLVFSSIAIRLSTRGDTSAKPFPLPV